VTLLDRAVGGIGSACGRRAGVYTRPALMLVDNPSLRGPFLTPVRRPLARTRLLCIPHAGGSAAVYYHWARQLDASVEPVAAQLPGRGHRLTEPPHRGL